LSANRTSKSDDALVFIVQILNRLEQKVDRLSNAVEELKLPQSNFKDWWEYGQLKDGRSGYAGISVLVALGKYRKFDKTVQWMKTAEVKKSTFHNVLKDLKRMQLVNQYHELTVLGQRVFDYVEKSSVPVIAKEKLWEIAEQLRAKHRS